MNTKFLFAVLLFPTMLLAQEDVDMNINMGGMGVDMNVNVNVRHSGNMQPVQGQPVMYEQAAPEHYVMPGYNGPIGCPWPMDESQFSGVRQSISARTFEDSRLTIAKQVVSSNCLFSSQVRDIMTLLTFEETRLEFAKFAYRYTYDLGNYYMLNDAFTFEMSIDELNEFIHGGY